VRFSSASYGLSPPMFPPLFPKFRGKEIFLSSEFLLSPLSVQEGYCDHLEISPFFLETSSPPFVLYMYSASKNYLLLLFPFCIFCPLPLFRLGKFSQRFLFPPTTLVGLETRGFSIFPLLLPSPPVPLIKMFIFLFSFFFSSFPVPHSPSFLDLLRNYPQILISPSMFDFLLSQFKIVAVPLPPPLQPDREFFFFFFFPSPLETF